MKKMPALGITGLAAVVVCGAAFGEDRAWPALARVGPLRQNP